MEFLAEKKKLLYKTTKAMISTQNEFDYHYILRTRERAKKSEKMNL